MILENGRNETKSEHFKGVGILSVPTVYLFWFDKFTRQNFKDKIGKGGIKVKNKKQTKKLQQNTGCLQE